MKVLIDGKEQIVNDIRVIAPVIVYDYPNDEPIEVETELHICLNDEGIVYDVLDPINQDYGFNTTWEMYQDIADRLS